MNDTRSSVDYRRSVGGFPTDSRQLAHQCACGEPPAFLVTVTEPLVAVIGPFPVCAECMPGMNQFAESLVETNHRRTVDVRAWS
jgi:hypothetical protein